MEKTIEERDVKNIGVNLYIVRKKELNKTQEEFAEMIGMSKDTISNIERGAFLPSMKCMVEISNVTNKSIDSFLIGRKENEDETYIPGKS